MKNFLMICVNILFSSIFVYAQDIPEYLTSEPKEQIEKKCFYDSELQQIKNNFDLLSSAIARRPYDVLKYDLYLDWYSLMKADSVTGVDRQYTGVNKITLKIDSSNVSVIYFDAGNTLNIQSVSVNANVLPATPQPDANNLLKITLPAKAQKGDTLIISISYKYIGAQDHGLYLYPRRLYVGQLGPPSYDSVFIEERIAYTMSEPQDARFWMPCNDSPHDKAIATIQTRVPLPFTVASNGLLQKIDTTGDSRTFTWSDDSPIATYLMAVTSSKFKEFSNWYHRVTKPGDSVEIKYFVWQKDYDATLTDGTQYNAKNTFKTTPGMIDFFSKAFIEYPFKKYGMVAVMPFSFGGMEHQTLTSVNRVWLRTNEQSGIAHELAHQWLGDLITCATWNDVWINEGGATWSEALYDEHLSNISSYYRDMRTNRRGYLNAGGNKLSAIYGLPINTLFASNAILVYQKASWVYHMLRTMLGDSVCFNALRSILTNHGYKSLETDDLKNLYKQYAPNPLIDYDTYFDQWVYQRGHPVFNYTTGITKGINSYTATIDVNQVQKDSLVPQVFKVPLRLIFFKDSVNSVADTVVMNSRNQTFTINIPFVPVRVVLDTNMILCQIQGSLLSVKENVEIKAEYNGANVYPNPVKSGESANIDFKLSIVNCQLSIEVYDILGEKIKTVYNGTLDEGNYTFSFLTDDMAAGTYFVRIKNNKKGLFKPFTVVK